MTFEVTTPVYSKNNDLEACPTSISVGGVKDLGGNTIMSFNTEIS
jgi:hypothetical protein